MTTSNKTAFFLDNYDAIALEFYAQGEFFSKAAKSPVASLHTTHTPWVLILPFPKRKKPKLCPVFYFGRSRMGSG
jgi:hypothetical protein